MSQPAPQKFDYDERLEALLQLAQFRNAMRDVVGVSEQYLDALPAGTFKDQQLARHRQLQGINEELLASLEATKDFIDGGKIYQKVESSRP